MRIVLLYVGLIIATAIEPNLVLNRWIYAAVIVVAIIGDFRSFIRTSKNIYV